MQNVNKNIHVKKAIFFENNDFKTLLPLITIMLMKILKVPKQFKAQNFVGLINISGKKQKDNARMITPVIMMTNPI